jgi:Lsr2
VRITLDSSEPLEDAMRVLGAMYDVQLVVSRDHEEPIENRSRTADTTTRARKASPRSKKRQSAARIATTSAGASTSRSMPSKRGRPSNAEVRSWARENGLAVSERGRLAQSVMAAYRSANSL